MGSPLTINGRSKHRRSYAETTGACEDRRELIAARTKLLPSSHIGPGNLRQSVMVRQITCPTQSPASLQATSDVLSRVLRQTKKMPPETRNCSQRNEQHRDRRTSLGHARDLRPTNRDDVSASQGCAV